MIPVWPDTFNITILFSIDFNNLCELYTIQVKENVMMRYRRLFDFLTCKKKNNTMKRAYISTNVGSPMKILLITENGTNSIFLMYTFIVSIRKLIDTENNSVSNFIKLAIQSIISAIRRMLDIGTATRFVSRNNTGN
jgi:hypothetical protein